VVIKDMLMSTEAISAVYPIVKAKTMLSGIYLSHVDTITPSQCFSMCRGDARCGGASFTSDYRYIHNCYFHTAENLQLSKTTEKIDLWTSYIKTTVVPTTSTTSTTTAAQMVEDIVLPPTMTDSPVTDPPVTDPPVTDQPVTDPPVTDPPSVSEQMNTETVTTDFPEPVIM
jgi:hypothetical protein